MTRFRPNFTAPMTLRKRAIGLLATVALAGSGGAIAGDFSVGVGAGVDRGRVDCAVSFPCASGSAHWKLFAGYRITETVEVQAVWLDAGHFKGGDTSPLGTEFGGTFEVSGFGLTGGYRWEFAPSWSLAGRAGLASVRTRFDYADAAVGSASKTTTQPLLGLGLACAITPAVRLSLDYDVTRFEVHTSRGPLQMLGLAVQYSF